MKSLPIEILNDIFLLLHHKDKVNCMLVCRLWAYVINTCSLLNTLHLAQTDSFENLITTLQKDPYKETQVERLILNLRLADKIDVSVIPTLFPNLRVIYLVRSNHRQFKQRPVQQLQWIPIECITEIVSHTLTYEILTSNLCSRLKILSVHANEYGISGRPLISLLVNAPCLSQLSMGAFGISFADLELLHETLPSIYSLKLTQTRIAHDFIPTHIEPAASIKIFTLGTHCDIIQMKTEWLRYIKRKYTCLREWELLCPNNTLDQPIGMHEFHKEGIYPLVQTFGSRLHTLSVNIKNYASNFFKVLDDGGCRIHHLKFSTELGPTALEDFTCSNQINSICTLVIDDADFKEFEWLKGLTELKELTLEYKYKFNVNHEAIMDVIQLNSLLDMCSLESLTIKKVYLNIDFTNLNVYQIKNLGLYDVPIPEKMDMFISNSFPHLRNLSLIFCGLYGTTFSLPEHHLTLVEVAERFYFNISHLLMITEKNRRQWYNADRTFREHTVFKKHSSIHDASLYPTTTQVGIQRKTEQICKILQTLPLVVKFEMKMNERETFSCIFCNLPDSEGLKALKQHLKRFHIIGKVGNPKAITSIKMTETWPIQIILICSKIIKHKVV
ncbi:hypothetical protein K501DRAFT_329278 [Backusella circina FSU 941]|nr:hypothetical protein K501DRAFT_329278 [Backusella circina FSU 941]